MASAMAVAVANWADESNGRIEARVFDRAVPADAELVPGTLAAMGLECLSGLTPRSRFSITSCPPSRAWQVLFEAASVGGAYDGGCFGAYGRLAAWRSLAGISGAAEGAAAEIELQVRECDWFSFDADTNWFEQVAWDIGLAAVRPGVSVWPCWPRPTPIEAALAWPSLYWGRLLLPALGKAHLHVRCWPGAGRPGVQPVRGRLRRESGEPCTWVRCAYLLGSSRRADRPLRCRASESRGQVVLRLERRIFPLMVGHRT